MLSGGLGLFVLGKERSVIHRNGFLFAFVTAAFAGILLSAGCASAATKPPGDRGHGQTRGYGRHGQPHDLWRQHRRAYWHAIVSGGDR